MVVELWRGSWWTLEGVQQEKNPMPYGDRTLTSGCQSFSQQPSATRLQSTRSRRGRQGEESYRSQRSSVSSAAKLRTDRPKFAVPLAGVGRVGGVCPG
jgi:hypothetical protein